MFGYIHKAIKHMILRKHGEETWRKILAFSNFEDGTESIANNYYKDENTFSLITSASIVLCKIYKFLSVYSTQPVSIDQIWELFGEFFVEFTMDTEWQELIMGLAADMKSFLDNVDALHYFIERVVYKFKLRGPSFRCDMNKDGSLILHYYSKRSGLYPLVIGILCEIARRVFKYEISVKMIDTVQEMVEGNGFSHVEEHVSFLIRLSGDEKLNHQLFLAPMKLIDTYANRPLSLNLDDFESACPYHVCFDRSLTVNHCGVKLKRFIHQLIYKQPTLFDIVDIINPDVAMTFGNFAKFINTMFVFKLKNLQHEFDDATNQTQNDVFLRGQMILLDNDVDMIYVCSPYVSSIKELLEQNLYLSDIPLYDKTRDLVLLNQSINAQVEVNKKLEQYTKQLRLTATELEKEKEKSERILNDLLPPTIVKRLKLGQSLDCGEYSAATVLFADIVGFTVICSRCKPIEVVDLLNDLYSKFDRMTILHEVYKVVTIGDAYMAVGGVPDICENHVERMCCLALGMLWLSKTVNTPLHEPLQEKISQLMDTENYTK